MHTSHRHHGDHHHADHHHGPAGATAAAERATGWVLGLTLVTMAVEIVAGWWTGSMALLADGWHMGTHAAAMAVAVVAYRIVRHPAAVARFGAGVARAPDLGGFANAVMLAVVAVLVAGESASRLFVPQAIAFADALWVATVGLAVNLLSAWLLRDRPHGHDHGHGTADRDAHPDHNREAALVHVLADALTSALAIVALWCGRRYGLVWLDPLMGIVGAAVILRWAYTLLRRTGAALLGAGEAAHPHGHRH